MPKSNNKRKNGKQKRYKPYSAPVTIDLHIISNDRNPYKEEILKQIYRGVYLNEIAYMDAKNTTTGEVESLMIARVRNPYNNQIEYLPIAKFLGPEDVGTLLAPDLKGGWVDSNSPQEELPFESEGVEGDPAPQSEVA